MDNDLSCQGTERSQAEITPPPKYWHLFIHLTLFPVLNIYSFM